MRRRHRTRRQLTPVAGAWLLLPAAALALLTSAHAVNPSQSQLQEAERARAEQLGAQRSAAARLRAAQAESRRLADQRVLAAAALQKLEAQTADAAEALDALARRRALAEQRLAERAADLGPVLPLIERLSLYPAETLLAVPASPEEALRGLLVLKGLARQLESEAAALRAEQAEVARLTAEAVVQDRRLTDAQARQGSQAAKLDRQIADAQARGQDAEDAGAEASRRAAEQAAQAANLRTVLAQIEAARRADEARARNDAIAADRQRHEAAAAEARTRQAAFAQPAGPELGEPHGRLAAPVAGAVLHSFGEPGEAGQAQGISYQAAPAARVSAPCGGRVVFAGPFRSFGVLLILDCGHGLHFVLAGLEHLDATVGRMVQPGEPVGAMPTWDPRTQGARPTLYVELRRDGQPINPAPFLRGRS